MNFAHIANYDGCHFYALSIVLKLVLSSLPIIPIAKAKCQCLKLLNLRELSFKG